MAFSNWKCRIPYTINICAAYRHYIQWIPSINHKQTFYSITITVCNPHNWCHYGNEAFRSSHDIRKRSGGCPFFSFPLLFNNIIIIIIIDLHELSHHIVHYKASYKWMFPSLAAFHFVWNLFNDIENIYTHCCSYMLAFIPSRWNEIDAMKSIFCIALKRVQSSNT